MTTLNDFLEIKEESENIIEVVEKKSEKTIMPNKDIIKIEKTKAKTNNLEKLKHKQHSNVPWTHKYKPKKLNEFVGNKKEIKQIIDFIKNYQNEKKKTLIIYGQNGIGKSVICETLSNELNLEFIELNASDKRNKAVIEEKLNNIIQQKSLFGTEKLILIDDIDGISGVKDRGGIPAIIKSSKNSKYPIILTCMNPHIDKLKSLRVKSKLVEFENISELDIQKKIKEILIKENIEFENKDLEIIADNSKGDLRAAINDTQMLSIKGKKLDSTILNEFEKRITTNTIEESLTKIFYEKPEDTLNALDRVENVDLNKTFLWIDENLPKIITNKLDRAKAYGCLTKADVFRKRIMKRQHWRFLSHIYFLITFGISNSNSNKEGNKYTNLTQPSRLLKIWQANMRYAKRKSICEKIAIKTHTSTKRILDDFYLYAKIISDSNIISIGEHFNLEKEEIAFCEKYIQKR